MSKQVPDSPTRMTVIRATLVQDSALSVSGIDRESTSDQPFAMIDGKPVLSGRGLKGAAVAMARRFFDLPSSVTEPHDKRTALKRSAWWFANSILESSATRLRPGVGILQKTGARATGILYDREVVEAGTAWTFEARVDHRLAEDAGDLNCEAEKILLYVLEKHWREGRCWLGGGVARGLGWCTAKHVNVHRLGPAAYDAWVTSGRQELPAPSDLSAELEAVKPHRSWVFFTRDLEITAGEYRPDGDQGDAWGVDMLAIAPHEADQKLQHQGDGTWAKPPWVGTLDREALLPTNRTIAMSGERPLLPGSSLRGPMRHAYSRAQNAAGSDIQDPHLSRGKVPAADLAGQLFGTVDKSSNVLIRDGRAEPGWCAARMHMHAEDEFSAGSYGSGKRTAVRLLKATIPIRIVIEGGDRDRVQEQAIEIDRLIALGALGHLPIGGHKTHGAGGGRWRTVRDDWEVTIFGPPERTPAAADDRPAADGRPAAGPSAQAVNKRSRPPSRLPEFDPKAEPASNVSVVTTRPVGCDLPRRATLTEGLSFARAALGDTPLTCWWCEPTIDLTVQRPPATFGSSWAPPRPEEANVLKIDELFVFARRASVHLVRTRTGYKAAVLRLEAFAAAGSDHATATRLPACLHQDPRFSAVRPDQVDGLTFYQWRRNGAVLGYTAEITGAVP